MSYRDQSYAKEIPIRSDVQPWAGLRTVPLYYLACDDDQASPAATARHVPAAPANLLITFDERLLQRFVDRSLERRAAREKGERIATAPAWLGESLAFRFERRLLEVLGKARGVDYNTLAQEASWGNLPILNQWHRLYPEPDPVGMHERLWRTRLVCPGGGKYVWNEEWQTMESTVYAHPGQPMPGPALPPSLASVVRGEFGLTLEEQGLRARAVLECERP